MLVEIMIVRIPVQNVEQSKFQLKESKPHTNATSGTLPKGQKGVPAKK